MLEGILKTELRAFDVPIQVLRYGRIAYMTAAVVAEAAVSYVVDQDCEQALVAGTDTVSSGPTQRVSGKA